ncbi:Peroxisomal membrane protein PMP27 [Pleurotus ostreatus]|uniref:Peroxisomal membrane protein PMP27 n=2 Tax=Pleurotus TaxID=5320 RepID=A0A8H7A1L6_PLEOS|nr:Peroxisomal membrane protein PMP27 [Pleurotus ostreatus]KAF7436947.1 Peroxisomal membrane protein PMP27 [Pleurotus ostreatus]KAG9222932.1 hypothetical protein CCMSSC00406_0000379 [Pleurotus cornucopiae]
MAAIASQVVLHPVVSQSLKMGHTTVGRDKTYRAIQYFARFYAWYLLSRGNKDEAARWSSLKSHLGTARKLMRLGKPMEHLQSAAKAALAPGTPVEQITTIGRQLGYFGYLTFDSFVWAHSIKFLKLKPETAAKNARLVGQIKALKSTKPWGEKDLGEEAEREAKLSALYNSRDALRHQLYIDMLDIWLPVSNLKYVNLNDGVLGILGVISSVLGWQKQWASVNGRK